MSFHVSSSRWILVLTSIIVYCIYLSTLTRPTFIFVHAVENEVAISENANNGKNNGHDTYLSQPTGTGLLPLATTTASASTRPQFTSSEGLLSEFEEKIDTNPQKFTPFASRILDEPSPYELENAGLKGQRSSVDSNAIESDEDDATIQNFLRFQENLRENQPEDETKTIKKPEAPFESKRSVSFASHAVMHKLEAPEPPKSKKGHKNEESDENDDEDDENEDEDEEDEAEGGQNNDDSASVFEDSSEESNDSDDDDEDDEEDDDEGKKKMLLQKEIFKKDKGKQKQIDTDDDDQKQQQKEEGNSPRELDSPIDFNRLTLTPQQNLKNLKNHQNENENNRASSVLPTDYQHEKSPSVHQGREALVIGPKYRLFPPSSPSKQTTKLTTTTTTKMEENVKPVPRFDIKLIQQQQKEEKEGHHYDILMQGNEPILVDTSRISFQPSSLKSPSPRLIPLSNNNVAENGQKVMLKNDADDPLNEQIHRLSLHTSSLPNLRKFTADSLNHSFKKEIDLKSNDLENPRPSPLPPRNSQPFISNNHHLHSRSSSPALKINQLNFSNSKPFVVDATEKSRPASSSSPFQTDSPRISNAADPSKITAANSRQMSNYQLPVRPSTSHGPENTFSKQQRQQSLQTFQKSVGGRDMMDSPNLSSSFGDTKSDGADSKSSKFSIRELIPNVFKTRRARSASASSRFAGAEEFRTKFKKGGQIENELNTKTSSIHSFHPSSLPSHHQFEETKERTYLMERMEHVEKNQNTLFDTLNTINAIDLKKQLSDIGHRLASIEAIQRNQAYQLDEQKYQSNLFQNEIKEIKEKREKNFDSFTPESILEEVKLIKNYVSSILDIAHDLDGLKQNVDSTKNEMNQLREEMMSSLLHRQGENSLLVESTDERIRDKVIQYNNDVKALINRSNANKGRQSQQTTPNQIQEDSFPTNAIPQVPVPQIPLEYLSPQQQHQRRLQKIYLHQQQEEQRLRQQQQPQEQLYAQDFIPPMPSFSSSGGREQFHPSSPGGSTHSALSRSQQQQQQLMKQGGVEMNYQHHYQQQSIPTEQRSTSSYHADRMYPKSAQTSSVSQLRPLHLQPSRPLPGTLSQMTNGNQPIYYSNLANNPENNYYASEHSYSQPSGSHHHFQS